MSSSAQEDIHWRGWDLSFESGGSWSQPLLRFGCHEGPEENARRRLTVSPGSAEEYTQGSGVTINTPNGEKSQTIRVVYIILAKEPRARWINSGSLESLLF